MIQVRQSFVRPFVLNACFQTEENEILKNKQCLTNNEVL